MPGEHDLGSTVVSCADVSSHLGVLNAGETEIADLEIAILVYENVAWLEITVDDACRVDVLETTENLVQEVLDKLLLERSARQETVQIGTEKFGNEVNVFERRDEDIAEADDVLVTDVLEQFELTVGTLGENGSGEGLHDLLDSYRVLVSWSFAEQTRPKAPMPTGCKSTYRVVTSKTVPKMESLTKSAILEI